MGPMKYVVFSDGVIGRKTNVPPPYAVVFSPSFSHKGMMDNFPLTRTWGAGTAIFDFTSKGEMICRCSGFSFPLNVGSRNERDSNVILNQIFSKDFPAHYICIQTGFVFFSYEIPLPLMTEALGISDDGIYYGESCSGGFMTIDEKQGKFVAITTEDVGMDRGKISMKPDKIDGPCAISQLFPYY